MGPGSAFLGPIWKILCLYVFSSAILKPKRVLFHRFLKQVVNLSCYVLLKVNATPKIYAEKHAHFKFSLMLDPLLILILLCFMLDPLLILMNYSRGCRSCQAGALSLYCILTISYIHNCCFISVFSLVKISSQPGDSTTILVIFELFIS